MQRSVMSALVLCLLLVGCRDPSPAVLPTTTFPLTTTTFPEAVPGFRIDEFAMTAVYSGVPVAAGTHPEGEFLEVAVDEVYWNASSFATTTKEIIQLAPISAGDRVITFPDVVLEIGERYFFLATESGIGGEVPQWNAIWVFQFDTMMALQPVEPPIDSILFPGESGPADIRAALTELVEQVFQAEEDELLGQRPKIGSRLALALDSRGG